MISTSTTSHPGRAFAAVLRAELSRLFPVVVAFTALGIALVCLGAASGGDLTSQTAALAFLGAGAAALCGALFAASGIDDANLEFLMARNLSRTAIWAASLLATALCSLAVFLAPLQLAFLLSDRPMNFDLTSDVGRGILVNLAILSATAAAATVLRRAPLAIPFGVGSVGLALLLSSTLPRISGTERMDWILGGCAITGVVVSFVAATRRGRGSRPARPWQRRALRTAGALVSIVTLVTLLDLATFSLSEVNLQFERYPRQSSAQPGWQLLQFRPQVTSAWLEERLEDDDPENDAPADELLYALYGRKESLSALLDRASHQGSLEDFGGYRMHAYLQSTLRSLSSRDVQAADAIERFFEIANLEAKGCAVEPPSYAQVRKANPAAPPWSPSPLPNLIRVSFSLDAERAAKLWAPILEAMARHSTWLLSWCLVAEAPDDDGWVDAPPLVHAWCLTEKARADLEAVLDDPDRRTRAAVDASLILVAVGRESTYPRIAERMVEQPGILSGPEAVALMEDASLRPLLLDAATKEIDDLVAKVRITREERQRLRALSRLVLAANVALSPEVVRLVEPEPTRYFPWVPTTEGARHFLTMRRVAMPWWEQRANFLVNAEVAIEVALDELEDAANAATSPLDLSARRLLLERATIALDTIWCTDHPRFEEGVVALLPRFPHHPRIDGHPGLRALARSDRPATIARLIDQLRHPPEHGMTHARRPTTTTRLTLHRLEQVTGQSFGLDVAAWRRWYRDTYAE